MKKTLASLFLLLVTIGAFAQTEKGIKDTDRNLINATEKGWHIRLSAGYNLGGAAPLPLPREIRSIDGYNPGLNLSIEGSVEKSFKESPWSVRMGIRLESKGMTSNAYTKNYFTEVMNDGNPISGPWTGNVKMKLHNTYITMPVLAVYTINERWNVSVGPYVSYLLDGSFSGEVYDGYIRKDDPTGQKTNVTFAEYDFSSDIRKFNWGLQAGGEFRAYEHLALFANLQWGLNGIFPTDFSCVTFALYPIFGTLGFTYLF